jgi:hypothetical protein
MGKQQVIDVTKNSMNAFGGRSVAVKDFSKGALTLIRIALICWSSVSRGVAGSPCQPLKMLANFLQHTRRGKIDVSY